MDKIKFTLDHPFHVKKAEEIADNILDNFDHDYFKKDLRMARNLIREAYFETLWYITKTFNVT